MGPSSRLEALRAEIDALDDQMLGLLERRAQVALAVLEEKRREGRTTAYDPQRQQRVLERLVSANGGGLPPASLRAIYREVMSACLALQAPLRVGLLASSGSPLAELARVYFGQSASYHETHSMEALLASLEQGAYVAVVTPWQVTDPLWLGPLVRRPHLAVHEALCWDAQPAGAPSSAPPMRVAVVRSGRVATREGAHHLVALEGAPLTELVGALHAALKKVGGALLELATAAGAGGHPGWVVAELAGPPTGPFLTPLLECLASQRARACVLGGYSQTCLP